MTLRNYAFNLTCEDGDEFWGKTGQKGWMITRNYSQAAALKTVQNYTPGGWKIEYVGVTSREPGLHPTGGHLS